MRGGLFIAGTDTDVGKTRVACLLVRALRELGRDAIGMKPFACGDREDAELLNMANGGTVEMGLVNPVWLRVPASPYAASLIENRILDIETARQACRKLRDHHEFVVVEGVGGWRVPLTDGECMSDFATELGLPVVLVVANRIGALNHARLSLEAIRSRGLKVVCILWNEVFDSEPDPARMTNRAVFEQLEPGVFQDEIPFGTEVLDRKVVEWILKESWR